MTQKLTYKELEQRVKELEQERKDSTLLGLQRLLSTAPAVYYTCRLTGDFGATYVSENIKEQLGYTPRDFTEDPSFWLDHIHPEDREAILGQCTREVSHLSPADIYSHEYRFLAEDGSYRWMHDQCRVIFNDEGKPIELAGVWVDISQRKFTEEKLQKAREKYERIQRHKLETKVNSQVAELRAKQKNITIFAHAVAGAIDPIIITQLDGHIFYSNKAAEDVYGYQKGEMNGLPVATLNPQPEMVRGMISTMIETGSWSGEILQQRKDSTTFPALLSLSTVNNDAGEPLALMGAVRDLTDRRRAEKEKEKLEIKLHQAQKMEAIGTLAGGIAHDFNNILSAILGYGELVLGSLPEGSSAHSDQKEIIKAGHRAKELVRQILTFSRRTKQELAPMKIRSAVNETVKLLHSTFPSNIDIRTSIDNDCGFVLAIPTQIHQVLMNLATNAYHAMREKGGLLSISLIQREIKQDTGLPMLAPGLYVVLEVADTGSGMDQATLERAFEPYFTTKEQGEGTGLGLAIVHGIVEELKGKMTVQSKVGEGTVFNVYIPLLDEAGEVPGSDDAEPLPIGTEHILLVDDEAVLAQLGKSMLEKLGYRVSVCTKSSEALAILQDTAKNFNLLITDQTMPGMTGDQLARKVLKVRPGFPIILCTGFSSIVSEEKAREIGIKGYAGKPFSIRLIANLIRKVLDE